MIANLAKSHSPALRLKQPAEPTAQPAPLENPEPKTPEDAWDYTTAREFLSGGLGYGFLKAVGTSMEWWQGMDEVPRVQLQEPVLFVQGFVAPPGQFSTALKHLTSDGLNGGAPVYIKDGQFFSDTWCKNKMEPGPESKVFRLIHDPLASPEVIADKMELATVAIEKVSGDCRPDVVAHSLGGLGARIYTDRGNKVGKLAMVGTPNQGSRAALLTKAALVNGISWATSLAHVNAAAIPALEWMVPTGNGNQHLQSLNSRWESQQAQTEGAVIIGANAFDSPSPTLESEPGDGLIEASSLQVGDCPTLILSGDESRKGHYTMAADPEIFQAYSDFFGWKPVKTGP